MTEPNAPAAEPTTPEPTAPEPTSPVDAVDYPFQAEVAKVLTLVIDSLYANKEVFLRELVSNASDALDKARLYALTHDDARAQQGEPTITITADEEAGTLTIADNGVGMTREEVVEHLGTIAKSGSSAFLERYRDAIQEKDATAATRLIGQFGVGFYSAFMVANQVDVDSLSMKHGESPVRWSSAGAGTFTVARGERQEPGTTITLHLKGDQHEFAHGYRLRDIIGKYSDFVGFPILVDGERANQPVALWTQPRSAVSDAQHEEFYRHVTGGLSDDKPIARVHYSVDAPVQFQALVYVPEKAPLDLFQKDRGGLRLYAKRVLILESCEKLLPSWLRFVRGVVDSEDLSLNVSREMLQESRALSQIEQLLTKQVIKSLKELAEGEPEKYEAFWRAFGKVVKEGVSSDFRNKDAVVELARFESMRGEGGKLTSLDAYVAAMPEGQSAIYYLTGPSRRAVEASPQLEALRDKGYDVLFLVDPIDEWVVSALPEHKSKKLVSVAHGEVELGESPTSEEPEKALDAVRTTLGERVKSVRFSRRLKESAACLVADVGDPGANMERILRMLDERADAKKRILELNPTHPIVRDIAELQAREPGSTRVASYCEALYDQALLADGVVEDPAALVRRMRELLAQAARSAATEGGAPGAASQ